MKFFKKLGKVLSKAFKAVKEFIKKHWKLILVIILICVLAYFAWQYFALAAANKTAIAATTSSAWGLAATQASHGATNGLVGAAAVAPTSGVISKLLGSITTIAGKGVDFVKNNPGITGAIAGGSVLLGLLKNKKLLLLLGVGLGFILLTKRGD